MWNGGIKLHFFAVMLLHERPLHDIRFRPSRKDYTSVQKGDISSSQEIAPIPRPHEKRDRNWSPECASLECVSEVERISMSNGDQKDPST